ncbi:MAG: hypothetical protein KatS3mg111_3381 [Pirellulaceae bacterium]|nr:MAG: hypothetical protein KatS3mg111_3381 [Pirellulaceae bacterium]
MTATTATFFGFPLASSRWENAFMVSLWRTATMAAV